MILFYSSNWSASFKGKWENWAKIVQSRGYVVVIADFTCISKGKLFQMKKDFVKILHWVNANCIQFGGDFNRLYVVGAKTGAHLVMHSILDSTFNILHSRFIIDNQLPPIYAVIL